MNSSVPDEQLAAIKEALFAGRKIEAIKIYRQSTGGALKDAKDAIDELEAALRMASPERFSTRKPGSCMTAFAFIGMAVLAAWWTFAR